MENMSHTLKVKNKKVKKNYGQTQIKLEPNDDSIRH